MSLVALAAGKLLGTDGILPVFVAVVAFDTAVSSGERKEEEQIQEAVNQFFTLPIFVLLSLTLPWREWLGLGWGRVLLAVAVLLLRRLPAVLALKPWVEPLQSTQDALFLGWFGPVGIAALYYANLSFHKTGIKEIWVVSSLISVASILV